MDAVSLRDIARAADVQVTLITRYVGSRDDLIDAVLIDLTERVARDVVEHPLAPQGFDRRSPMGRWTVVMNHYAVTGRRIPRNARGMNPVDALAEVIRTQYGLDEETARVRGMQIVASALGWRIFEDLLLRWGATPDIPRDELREELTRLHRRLGATPWPSPPDPPTVV